MVFHGNEHHSISTPNAQARKEHYQTILQAIKAKHNKIANRYYAKNKASIQKMGLRKGARIHIRINIAHKRKQKWMPATVLRANATQGKVAAKREDNGTTEVVALSQVLPSLPAQHVQLG